MVWFFVANDLNIITGGVNMIKEKISDDDSSNDLYQQNLLYEAIFDQVPIGIAVSYNCNPVDLSDDNHPNINPMYEQIAGRTKEEMIKLGWGQITHPEDLQKNLDKYNELQEGKINLYQTRWLNCMG